MAVGCDSNLQGIRPREVIIGQLNWHRHAACQSVLRIGSQVGARLRKDSSNGDFIRERGRARETVNGICDDLPRETMK